MPTELQEDLEVANSLRNLGLAQSAQENHAQAYKNMEPALAIYQTVCPNSVGKAECLTAMANALFTTNISKTIELYFDALTMLVRILDPSKTDIVHNCYHNLGAAYLEAKNYELAVVYLEPALDLRRQLHGDESKAFAIASEILARAYTYLYHTDSKFYLPDLKSKPIMFLQRARNIFQTLGDSAGVARTSEGLREIDELCALTECTRAALQRTNVLASILF